MSITLDEIYAEMEKLRNKKAELTDEQKSFLTTCRDEEKGIVSWDNIASLWVKAGWGNIGATTLRRHWDKVKG